MTTSWDDGHPLDWRIADLLAKYDLPGTFYIPRTSQRPTMSEVEARHLADGFEIGGHTLDHLALTTLSVTEAAQQIRGCKSWLEDITGRQCTAFCPPLGKFDVDHLAAIADAGFRTVRTVELLSTDPPRPMENGLVILPTTLQAYPHRLRAYARNALRRHSARNLLTAVLHVRGADWVSLARRMLHAAAHRGGVFHLWGHSWEIEESGQWGQLEEALRLISERASDAPRFTNSQLVALGA